jgi:hypothetical protein
VEEGDDPDIGGGCQSSDPRHAKRGRWRLYIFVAGRHRERDERQLPHALKREFAAVISFIVINGIGIPIGVNPYLPFQNLNVDMSHFAPCSATIAARTALAGESIGGICSAAKKRRLVLPSIGDDEA